MSPGRVHRLLKLITLLQAGTPKTVEDLMHELAISRRTLFRDLKTLDVAGIPCYHEPGKGYRILRSFFLPPLSLTVPETLGLMMLGKTAAASRDKPMNQAALSAVYKLINTVPEPLRAACADIMANVSFTAAPQVPGNEEAAHYAALQRCVDESRACRITYQPPAGAEPFEAELKPYALHFAARAWYVFGPSDLHDDVRIYKLVRMTRVAPTDRPFARPEAFTVARHLGNAWQLIPDGPDTRVQLLFEAKVARNVSEVRWHPTQEHELLPDGRCRMTFTVAGLTEIAWWLCGYAGQVSIESPKELRQRVQQMHHDAAKRLA